MRLNAMVGASASLRALGIGLVALLCSAVASAHPANIPVARAKIQPDGQIELSVRFDVLAFVLQENPMTVMDPPMNALLDGPVSDLESQLAEARARFVAGLAVGSGADAAIVDSVEFPDAKAVLAAAKNSPPPRLPVMMTATVRAHLKATPYRSTFRFPKEMGPVVLTTEFPYHEPLSESVDAGNASQERAVPTSDEIQRAAAAMGVTVPSASPAEAAVSERQARREIQRRYDRWSRAYMAHDLPTLMEMLAADYTIKTAKGDLIRRAEYEAMLKIRKAKHSDTTRYRTEILRLTLHDDVAAIFSRETTTNPRRNETTGKPELLSYQHDYIDVWIRTGHTWKLKNTTTLKEQPLPTPG